MLEKAELFKPVWLNPTWLALVPLNRAPVAIERLPLKFEPPKFPKCVLADIELSADPREIAEERPAEFPPVFKRDIADDPPVPAPAVLPCEVANEELPRPVIGPALLTNECHCPSAFAARAVLAPLAARFPPAVLEFTPRFPPAMFEFIPRFPENDRLLNAGIPIGRPFDARLAPPLNPLPRPFMLGFDPRAIGALDRYAPEGAPPRYPPP